MAKLYELTGFYLDLYQMDIDDDTRQDTLESIDWQQDFDNKVVGFAKAIKNLKADIAMYDTAEKEFKAKKEASKKRLSWFEETLRTAMTATGQREVKNGLFTVKVAENPQSVKVDLTLLPKEYFTEKVEVKPDKKRLKELLKDGEIIKGAELIRTEKLVIK